MCVCVCTCMCVCVCVCERERERECVCACYVCTNLHLILQVGIWVVPQQRVGFTPSVDERPQSNIILRCGCSHLKS